VKVPLLQYIPMAWAPYFMAAQSPEVARRTVSAYLIIAVTVLPSTAHSYYIYSGLLLYRFTSQCRTDYCTSLRQCLLTLPTTLT